MELIFAFRLSGDDRTTMMVEDHSSIGLTYKDSVLMLKIIAGFRELAGTPNASGIVSAELFGEAEIFSAGYRSQRRCGEASFQEVEHAGPKPGDKIKRRKSCA